MKQSPTVITEHASKKFLIGLSVMAAGFLFFLSSGLVFGDQDHSKVQQTPLQEPLHLQGSGEMRIEEWAYNPTKQLMIVSIYLDKSTVIQDDTLTFVAQEKSNPNRAIPTTLVYRNEHRYIISIEDVSASFDVMALNINKQESTDNLFAEDDTQQIEKSEDIKEMARIYADQQTIAKDNQLSIQTEHAYERNFLLQEIKQTKKTRKEKEKRIKQIDQRLNELEQEMVELESEMLYETEEEKRQTSARIDQLQSEIDQLNQKAVEEETSIQVMQEKLVMLREKREMLVD